MSFYKITYILKLNYSFSRIILKHKKELQEESYITATVYSENVMPFPHSSCLS